MTGQPMQVRRLVLAAVAALAGIVGSSAPARAAPKDEFKAAGDLVRQAKRGPLRERLPAIDDMGRIRQRDILHEWKVVDVLVGLARDRNENPRIQRAAIKALGQLFLGVDRSIKEQIRDPMVKILDDAAAHVIVRKEVASRFSSMCSAKDFGDVSMMNSLLRAAKTSAANPPEVAESATIALGTIGDPKAATVILGNLSHREALIRDAAIEAVSLALKSENGDEFLKDPNLQRKLSTLLTDPAISAGARDKILELVGDVLRGGRKFPGAEEALLQVLSQEKERASAVASALRAVSAIGSTKVASILPDVYKRFGPDSDIEGKAEVRVEVCSAAGELFITWAKAKGGTPMSSVKVLVDLLVAAVNDEDPGVAKEAVVSLGNLYSRKYDRTKPTAMLIVLLSEEGIADDLKGSAQESLEVLTGRSFRTSEEWEAWFERSKSKLRGSGR